MRAERKYALDTHLFIQGFRDEDANTELQRFHVLFAPFEFLLAVVVQELRTGADGRGSLRLQRHLFAPFERRSRIIVPTYVAWKRTGEVLAALAQRGSLARGVVPRSFVNDVLIAMSCLESGVTLVTANTRDFARIAAVRPFDFTAPWPTPSS